MNIESLQICEDTHKDKDTDLGLEGEIHVHAHTRVQVCTHHECREMWGKHSRTRTQTLGLRAMFAGEGSFLRPRSSTSTDMSSLYMPFFYRSLGANIFHGEL